ncbi:MAG: bifunctional UDP-N-acetylglucosamine diphosphorylase/glucosamine-1-phosphate N-acetyltransferase GlmU [Acidiferrobacterales bacterium]
MSVKKKQRLEVVVLAAGKGTRMHSKLPKVLHEIGDKALLGHVLDTAVDLGADAIHVIYGHGGETVPECFPDHKVDWVLQAEQNGTGHAVQQALPHIKKDATVLVLYGDVPLIKNHTLQGLVDKAGTGKLSLLTAVLADPAGYGRIVRDNAQNILRIVEKKDASQEELQLNEINTGFLAAPSELLKKWLAKLENNNAQGEFYLTDIIAMAVTDGTGVISAQPENEWEIMGVNSKIDLAALERYLQNHIARDLLQQGVTLRDPFRIDVRGKLTVAQDVTIDVNTVFEGNVTLGEGVIIGPNCVLKDVEIGSGTIVLANCVFDTATIGKNCRIGPFSRIRPEAKLANDVQIGNFVEIKKSDVADGSKINHLSYVGDTTVGKKVNIGAGTITCNYDGVNKHRTVIGDNAFIGSDSQLVAPVTVAAGATIGAGTTLTRDAPAGDLTLSRAKQKTISGWERPKKK